MGFAFEALEFEHVSDEEQRLREGHNDFFFLHLSYMSSFFSFKFAFL